MGLPTRLSGDEVKGGLFGPIVPAILRLDTPGPSISSECGVVPLLTAITWSTPVRAANSSSSRLTNGPWATIPDLSTLSTSSSTSGPKRITVMGMVEEVTPADTSSKG